VQYNGEESVPMIKMLVQVRWALEELGISVPWNEHGPVCDLDVPRAGEGVQIRREFSAEADRLIVTTVLAKPVSLGDRKAFAAKIAALGVPGNASLFLRLDGCLAAKDIIQVMPGDVTPRFMGKLLCRTTNEIILAAEAIGIIGKT
jgi:hypothetical protein